MRVAATPKIARPKKLLAENVPGAPLLGFAPVLAVGDADASALDEPLEMTVALAATGVLPVVEVSVAFCRRACGEFEAVG